MSIRSSRLALAVVGVLVAAAPALVAHHAIAAKFDETKAVTLNGIVTDVDWKNPHVHILINVKTGNDVINWAVELESPIALQQSGWGSDTVQVGDTLTVQGISARNGSKQAWARSVVMKATRPTRGASASTSRARGKTRCTRRGPLARERSRCDRRSR